MSTYDSYETVDAPRRHKSHRHRDRDYDPEPRYVETQETYVRGSPALAPDAPYSSRQDLIRRPHREDSDLSVEEVRRDFPPPGGAAYIQSRTLTTRDDRYGPPVRARSAERGSQYSSYLGDQREDRHSRRKEVKEEVVKTRRRSLSRNQKIIAGVAGAALAVGAKELYDRRQSHGAPKERNLLASAGVAAAGAFAGYEGAEQYTKRFGKETKVKEKSYSAVVDRDGNVAEYYSSGDETARPKSSRRKSIIEGALGLAGLGAAAKAGHDHRSRRGSDESTKSGKRGDRPRGGEGVAKFQQAAKAALLAGAAEAFRVRNEPGGWGGAKGKRILTAAIGAGGIDAAADRDPEHKSKRHILEAVVGGLAGNRLINGSRNEVAEENRNGGRSRSRSRGPGGSGGGAGLAALATAGLGALAGKKLLDRSRSRSRGGDNERSRRRYSSEESGSPDRRHRRSKSVTDYARKGLAALGIGEAAEAGRDRGDRREVYEEETVTRKSHRRRDDDDYERSRGDPYGDSRYADSRSSNVGSRSGGGRSARQKDGQRNRRVAEGRQSGSDSDSIGSSSGDEKKIKKMKGKQLITAGLATVATIHAAHNVYQSVEKRNARHKAVQEGEMTPEEARKLKAKARLQDAASIGIAALGIKGAYSEWKEMREMRGECRELEEKKEERHKKRLERQKQLQIESSASDQSSGLRRSDRANASMPDIYGARYSAPGPRYLDDNPYSALPAPPLGNGYSGR